MRNFTWAGLLISFIVLSFSPWMFAQNVGFGTTTPDQKIDIEGSTDQFVRIHTTSAGSSNAGIELLRSTEASGTDWKIVNEGGTLRFYDAINNFLSAGDLNMTLTNVGNLGLGTDSPASHFHVAGIGDQFLTAHRTTAGAGMSGINLLRDTEFSGTDWRIANDGGVFKLWDGTDNFQTPGDLDLVITQAGNMGLGILSPEATLHVVGSQLISETGEGYLQLGSPSGVQLRMDNNEILARNGDAASPLYLQFWSGNLLLCDDNAGRVGIGTSSPQAKLQITDGSDVSLAGGGEIVLGLTTTSNLAMDGNEIQARNNGASSALFLQTSGGDVLMVPNETGQVGIGVTSSTNMPSNEYLLAVDGKIISEEVRVEVSGSWPDYVFQPGYALISLEELEQHIQTNGHLPGIPTAAQVHDEGILLGDMQRVVMEKIEELTLYVIALQKEMETLKSQNAKSLASD